MIVRAYRRLESGVDAWRYERLVRRDATELIRKIESSGSPHRGLFIDCGSNVGQGLAYFARFFPPKHFDYILIEPNPHCVAVLESSVLPRFPAQQARLIASAVATEDGEARLYGLTEDARGALSEGASIRDRHNTMLYASDETTALTVQTLSFSRLLEDESPTRSAVVVKMDIESAEYDVLRDMLSTGAAELVSLLFVEFHSQYMVEPDRANYQRLEHELLGEFGARGVKIHSWR